MYQKVMSSEYPIPKIVCLCGSTRFANEFMQAQFQETLAGRIVLSVGCFPRRPDGTRDQARVSDEQKVVLDELHKRKIDLADEIFVLNVKGYIGPSTASEIAYARAHGKPVRYRDVSADGGKTWTVTGGIEVWVGANDALTRCTFGPVLVEQLSTPIAGFVAPERLRPTETLRPEDYYERR